MPEKWTNNEQARTTLGLSKPILNFKPFFFFSFGGVCLNFLLSSRPVTLLHARATSSTLQVVQHHLELCSTGLGWPLHVPAYLTEIRDAEHGCLAPGQGNPVTHRAEGAACMPAVLWTLAYCWHSSSRHACMTALVSYRRATVPLNCVIHLSP